MRNAQPYGVIVGRNISAARGRVHLSQVTVAARMRALGYPWEQQTLASVEKAKRRVTAEEIAALAWALETSIFGLMKPTEDDGLVEFPTGDVVAGHSFAASVGAHNDGAVTWDDTQSKFTMTELDQRIMIVRTPRITPGGS